MPRIEPKSLALQANWMCLFFHGVFAFAIGGIRESYNKLEGPYSSITLLVLSDWYLWVAIGVIALLQLLIRYPRRLKYWHYYVVSFFPFMSLVVILVGVLFPTGW